jgi:hypothetical protein
MTVEEDLGRAAAAVAAVRRSVGALQSRLGDTLDVRRLTEDVARLEADLDILGATVGAGRAVRGEKRTDVVYIPEGDYDPSFWAGADDELGPHGRA